MKKKIKVLTIPKSREEVNPTLANIFNGIEKLNEFKIYDFNIRKTYLLEDHKIINIQWLEYFTARPSILLNFIGCIYILLQLTLFKLRNSKLIWTIHNLKPHINKRFLFYDISLLLLVKLIDGYIVMSKNSRKEAIEKYPTLRNKKYLQIYHPIYNNYKNNISRMEARKKFGLNEDDKVILYIGTIRPYKNVIKLIKEFNIIRRKNYKLIIAGRCQSDYLRNEIESLSHKNPNIILNLNYINNNDLQYYFKSAEVAIFPFSEIHNSASVMLSLTFSTPVICPAQGSLIELSEILGRNKVFTYQKLTFQTILNYFDNKSDDKVFNTNIFSIENVSSKINKFYKEIIYL